MQNTTLIKNDLVYLGSSDRHLPLFENIYPTPDGMSYNSYLLKDEKTVLFDTVDNSVGNQFMENLEYSLDGKSLDYVIINHMEPDHCAMLTQIVLAYPDVKIVGNSKTFTMMKQFFSFDVDSRSIVIKEGDTLNTGIHTLAFYMAPMVHWPEVMLTYDQKDKILFSADAFGTFGAVNGNIFADEINFKSTMLAELRRYYANIVGKYGLNVINALKKLSELEIDIVCPLHGPVWRENTTWLIEKYEQWASYTPEEAGVVIAYASIYGNTENAANILAKNLSEMGVSNISVYDVSTIHHSYILSECFKYSNIVVASPTYNADIFPIMESLLIEIRAHNLQNRTIAIIENGTWAAQSGKKMKEILGSVKNTTIIDEIVSIKSSVSKENETQLINMAKQIAANINK